MKRGILLLATIGAAFLVASGLAVGSTVGLGKLSEAHAQTPAAKAKQPEDTQVGDTQQEVSTRVFHVQWGSTTAGLER